jgi:hypothetical protein
MLHASCDVDGLFHIEIYGSLLEGISVKLGFILGQISSV